MIPGPLTEWDAGSEAGVEHLALPQWVSGEVPSPRRAGINGTGRIYLIIAQSKKGKSGDSEDKLNRT